MTYCKWHIWEFVISQGNLVYQANYTLTTKTFAGHLPQLLSMVSSRFLTPLPALLLQSVIAVAMAFIGQIGDLIDFFSFAVWLFYALTFLANIVMRYQRTFKVRRENWFVWYVTSRTRNLSSSSCLLRCIYQPASDWESFWAVGQRPWCCWWPTLLHLGEISLLATP